MAKTKKRKLGKKGEGLSRKQRVLGIVNTTIKIMSDPNKWCQGFWAMDDRANEIDSGLAAEQLTGLDYTPVDGNYCAANSPEARKFCVEGAIFHAAGDFYKSLGKGEEVAREVIARLDEVVNRHEYIKEEGDYGYGGNKPIRSAQSLNDHNGDKSRERLVDLLKVVRSEVEGR